MATSGSTDFTLTARQIINFALKKIGALEGGGTASPEDADDAKEELNLLLKGMQKRGPFLFTTATDGSVSLVADQQSYDLTTVKPLRLIEVRYRDTGGREIPMTELTRTEYWELPNKDSKGVPTTFWFHPESVDYTLYVWPVKASVTTQTIKYTYQRRIEDIDSLDDNIDVPEEWLDTIGYQLAYRLLPSFNVTGERAARITQFAAELWQAAKDYDREPIITMEPEMRWGRGRW